MVSLLKLCVNILIHVIIIKGKIIITIINTRQHQSSEKKKKCIHNEFICLRYKKKRSVPINYTNTTVEITAENLHIHRRKKK